MKGESNELIVTYLCECLLSANKRVHLRIALALIRDTATDGPHEREREQ
jgi:hypothetical protein